MPGNYGNHGNGANRTTLWEQLPFGKRKFCEEDVNLSGPSTSTGVGESCVSGKRHCLHVDLEGRRDMPPSIAMEFDDYSTGPAQPTLYPSTLYSHMVPYTGTPPAPQAANSRPEFPRADATSPNYSNMTREQAMQLMRQKRDDAARNGLRSTQTAFCQDHCRNGIESPNSQFVRCFCRPSWEGMVSSVPLGNDYY